MQWSTGHSNNAYIIVLHGSNESWLGHPRFMRMVDDYIASAPDGVDTARVLQYQRQHGLRPNDRQMSPTRFLAAQNVTRIPSEDPTRIVHPNTPTLNSFRYSDAVLADDRRISYASDAYPWIEAAYRYDIQTGRPFDRNGIRVSIPGRAGPGHYIAHWRWSGYTDCTDVEYFVDP